MAEPSSNIDRDAAAKNPAPEVLSSPSPPVLPAQGDAEQNVAPRPERLSGSALNDIALAEDEVVREQGPICAGRFFEFMFQRVTYYWVALVFQIAQTGLAVAGCMLIRAHLYLGYNYYIFTRRQTLYMIAVVSTAIVISLIYLTFCHYYKSPQSREESMNAGKHYQISNRCAWANVVCLILFQAMYHDIPWTPQTPKLLILYKTISPLLFASQLLCLLACFAASNLTYIGALRARGEGMVHDLHLRVPAWTLATTYETTGYTREREIQLEP